MAYTRMVRWPSPYSPAFQPLGRYYLTYTKVVADVPLIAGSRSHYGTDGKVANSVLLVAVDNTLEVVTTIPYDRHTVAFYVDGARYQVSLEVSATPRKLYISPVSAVIGKAIYVSYVPESTNLALGNHTGTLMNSYNLISVVETGTKLREILSLARNYVKQMCIAIGIEPPTFWGGIGNSSVGPLTSLQAGLTPISVSRHLVDLRDAVNDIVDWINQRVTQQLLPLGNPEFSHSFIHGLMRTLTECDEKLRDILT